MAQSIISLLVKIGSIHAVHIRTDVLLFTNIVIIFTLI